MKQKSNRFNKGTILILFSLWFCSGSFGDFIYGASARISMNEHVKSLYSNTGTAANAMDGDFGTYCQGDVSNSWLMLALDDTITIDNIE